MYVHVRTAGLDGRRCTFDEGADIEVHPYRALGAIERAGVQRNAHRRGGARVASVAGLASSPLRVVVLQRVADVDRRQPHARR